MLFSLFFFIYACLTPRTFRPAYETWRAGCTYTTGARRSRYGREGRRKERERGEEKKIGTGKGREEWQRRGEWESDECRKPIRRRGVRRTGENGTNDKTEGVEGERDFIDEHIASPGQGIERNDCARRGGAKDRAGQGRGESRRRGAIPGGRATFSPRHNLNSRALTALAKVTSGGRVDTGRGGEGERGTGGERGVLVPWRHSPRSSRQSPRSCWDRDQIIILASAFRIYRHESHRTPYSRRSDSAKRAALLLAAHGDAIPRFTRTAAARHKVRQRGWSRRGTGTPRAHGNTGVNLRRLPRRSSTACSSFSSFSSTTRLRRSTRAERSLSPTCARTAVRFSRSSGQWEPGDGRARIGNWASRLEDTRRPTVDKYNQFSALLF